MICPVCGNSEMKNNICDVCDICGWEDDNVQQSDHNYFGGANRLSVNESRIEYFLLHTEKTKEKAAKLKNRYYESVGEIYKQFAPVNYVEETEKADILTHELDLARERYIDSLNELLLSLIEL